MAVITAASAVAIAVGGVAASQWIQSPAQAAADARPPAPSTVTAPVVRQVLRSTTVVRGTFSNGRAVTAHPTAVAATAASDPDSALIITGVFTKPGRKAAAGRALVEYSGRPVFALPGVLPAYRDLHFGDSGKDVAQLQKALRSLGHSTAGDPSGKFKTGTASALGRMYKAMGYVAPLSGPADSNSAAPAEQKASSGSGSGTAKTGASEGPPRTSGAGQDRSSAEGADSARYPMLPRSEVLFVATLPARVASVPLQIGDTISGPVLTLARSELTLTGKLDPAQADLVQPGMAVSILAESTGAEQQATVASVGPLKTPDAKSGDSEKSAAPEDTTPYLPLVIKPARPWDSKLVGQDVRITISAAATEEPVLTLPVSALSAGADTKTTVTVADPGGSRRTVTVKAGASADGIVAVTPVNGRLNEGDKVVVSQ
ncbi:peptidoglycan-binding protein [Streptomyces sp. NPDC087440]|uniref:peptidoglycan-binding protein n=1 Tax=Streptomyces sp. NPDC087440 TaxID=3365790 RepID=UPI0037FA15F5